MKTRFLLLSILFMLVSVSKLKSQDTIKGQDITLDFQYVESESYALFLKGEWQKVINLGKMANDQGIDYYYLNYRIGVSYFYQNKFFSCIRYLEKAIRQNSEGKSDVYLITHLYKSYVYTNQYNRAALLVDNINELDRLKTSVDKVVREISYDHGVGLSRGYSDSLDNRPNNDHIEYDLETGFRFLNFTFAGQVFPKLHYSFAFSTYESTRDQRILDVFRDIHHQYRTQQFQSYFAGDYIFKRGWSIHPAFLYSYFTDRPFELTNPTDLPALHIYEEVPNYYHQYAVSFDIRKTYRNFLFMTRGGYSKLLDSIQKQVAVSAVYYPFGNLNFYTKLDLAFRMEGDSTFPVISLKAGSKINKNLWFESFAIIGKINNYQEDNAFNIYNLPDNIKAIFGANIILLSNRQVNFRLSYQFFASEQTKYMISPITQNKPQILNYKFNKHLISGGITWKL